MFKYRITYLDGGDPAEIVEAGSYSTSETWLEFRDGAGLITQVRVENVARVDRG